MFIYFFSFFINQTHSNLQRCSISHISLFTLFDRILCILFVKCKVDKFQTELSAIVCDWRNVVEYFLQSFVKKPLVGIFLDFNQIGHFQDFFLSLVAHAHAFSSFYRTNSVFFH